MAPHSKTEKRRQEIVGAAAAHLIEHGLQKSGLRAIAESAGMSDRMIMYYFETKDDLVAAALTMIGETLALGMESAVPQNNLSARQVLDALKENLKSNEVQAVMRLWFEIIGMAMRGQQPYSKTAALLLSRSEESLRAKLRSDQKHRAREVLASLEGEMMISLLID